MANWNFITKLISTIGMTAFGVGLTGTAVKGMKNDSIFNGYFPMLPNNSLYNMQNPYAFLNANPVLETTPPVQASRVRKAQSAPPPTR